MLILSKVWPIAELPNGREIIPVVCAGGVPAGCGGVGLGVPGDGVDPPMGRGLLKKSVNMLACCIGG